MNTTGVLHNAALCFPSGSHCKSAVCHMFQCPAEILLFQNAPWMHLYSVHHIQIKSTFNLYTYVHHIPYSASQLIPPKKPDWLQFGFPAWLRSVKAPNLNNLPSSKNNRRRKIKEIKGLEEQQGQKERKNKGRKRRRNKRRGEETIGAKHFWINCATKTLETEWHRCLFFLSGPTEPNYRWKSDLKPPWMANCL